MICAACGFKNPGEFRFCGGCGTALGPADGAARLESHADSAAERRSITVLFCDLVGSTDLAERLDDESYRDVVRTYQGVATAAVERFGGKVAQHLGDGLMAYFGFPVANEEDPRRAVLAGLAICEAVPAANASARQPRDVELAVRIGIHTGQVIAGNIGAGEFREQLALGRTPNVAARVEGLAEPGAVLVSDDTWHLVRGFFDGHSLGPATLKGVARPVVLHRIVGTTSARTAFEAKRSGGLASMIGRSAELDRLNLAVASAIAGTGAAIGIRGEAGIGKSRLADAFRNAVASSGRARWLAGQCSPYDQGSAYAPLAPIVVGALGLGSAASASAAQVGESLSSLGIDGGEAVALLSAFLGIAPPTTDPLPPMTPLIRKERTLTLVADVVARRARQKPGVVFLEDLHWADPSTLEFLGLLAARAGALPLVLCVTFRPEFEAPWLPADAVVGLDRLTFEESRALATATARRQLPDQVYTLIHARTDGVPLFVEELTKVVVESGVLDDDRATDTAAWGAAIPGSLRDSLAARLDRLGPARRVAQLAAVIGRDFGRELLDAVSDAPSAVTDDALDRLVQAGLAFREGVPSQLRYTFKHALIRDAAYDSLLRPDRLQLHARVAAAIRDRFPHLRESRPDLVAHHMTEAGERAGAIPLWLEAGKRAMERSANVEAVGFLSRGIAAVDDVPEGPPRALQELELQMTLASAAMLAGGYGQPRVQQAYARAHALSSELGSPPQLFVVYFGLWMYYVVTADFARALEVCKDLARMAAQIGKPGYQVEALFCTAYTEYYMGRLRDAQGHFHEAIALESSVVDDAEFRLSPAGDDVRIHSRAFLGMTEWHLGLADRAVRTAEDGVRVAREIGYPYGVVWGLDSLGWVHVFRNDPDPAASVATEMIGISKERGFPFFVALGGLIVGWCAMRAGDVVTGLPIYEQSLAGLQMAGAHQSQTLFFSHLAAAYIGEGRLDDAERQITAALEAIERTGERAWEPEVHLARGALALARLQRGLGTMEDAAGAFADARTVARAQGAAGYTVRACLQAALMLPAGRERDEAIEELRAVLAEVDVASASPDIVAARALFAA